MEPRATHVESAALQHSRLPVSYTSCKTKLGQSRSLPALTQLPSRFLACEVSPLAAGAQGALPRQFVQHGKASTMMATTARSEDDQLTLRERLASSRHIVKDLKPECLAKLDAILAEKGPPGVFLPALDKFASHAHKFRGEAYIPEMVEDVPFSGLASPLLAEDITGFIAATPLQGASASTASMPPPVQITELRGRPLAETGLLGGSSACVGSCAVADRGRGWGGGSRDERSKSPPVKQERQSISPPPALGPWRLERARSSPGVFGGVPTSGRRSRAALASVDPTATTTVHRPCWGDTFWLEEVPTSRSTNSVRVSSDSPEPGRQRRKPSPVQRAKGHAERHGALGAAAEAAHAFAAAAASAQINPGPVLLNSNEAALARKQLALAATSSNDDGLPTLGWRLRSLEKNSLRSFTRTC